MWSARTEKLDRASIFRVEHDHRPIGFADVLRRWQDDAVFREFFIALLADAPYSAFRWETPPVTSSSADRPFEFALLDSPELESEPDPDAFAEHFRSATGDDVVSFHDAILVVPRPLGPSSAYGHIADFVREAPEGQKHSLWRLVGKLMEHRLKSTPVWLSTAGAGVPWLHVRLDQRPKYYSYAPYRQHTDGFLPQRWQEKMYTPWITPGLQNRYDYSRVTHPNLDYELQPQAIWCRPTCSVGGREWRGHFLSVDSARLIVDVTNVYTDFGIHSPIPCSTHSPKLRFPPNGKSARCSACRADLLRPAIAAPVHFGRSWRSGRLRPRSARGRAPG